MEKEPQKTKVKFKKNPISLELHSDFIKLVVTISSKPKMVFRFVKEEFSSKEDKDISQKITQLFKTHNLPRRSVFLNVPRHFVMAKVLHLPSTNDDEIKNMVKMESVRESPYSEEDVIIGYRIIDKSKDGYSDVLSAIIETRIINRFIDILKMADLTVEKIMLSSEALFGWYSIIKEKEKKEPHENIALLNVDSEYIDIDITEKGKVFFTRAISYIPERRLIQKETIDEIKKTISTYEKERRLRVDKIRISGAENKIKELEPALREAVDISMDVIPQTRYIELDKSVKIDLGETSFIELVGLSIKAEDMKINLLPERLIEDGEVRLLKKNLVRTLVLLASIVLVSSGIIAKRIFDKAQYLSLLNSKIKAMEPDVEKAERMKEDITIIKNVIQKRPLAIDILAEIYKIVPQGVRLDLLDYESGDFLIARGDAPSLNDIINFVSLLEKSQYFENAKIKYTARRSLAGKELTDFEIICPLSKIKILQPFGLQDDPSSHGKNTPRGQ